MRARFSGLTAIISLIALALMLPVRADVGSSIKGAGLGGTIGGNVELRDNSDISQNSIAEPDFATHAKWSTTGDFNDTGGNCTYTYSTGSGTCYQNRDDSSQPYLHYRGLRWAKYTYTVSAVAGTTPPVCSLTTATALTAQPLISVNGTYSFYFQIAAVATTSTTISCTSGASGTPAITFDNLALNIIEGGDLSVNGEIWAGNLNITTGNPGYAFLSEKSAGMYLYSSCGAGTCALGLTANTNNQGIVLENVTLRPRLNTAVMALGTYYYWWKTLYLKTGIMGGVAKSLTDAAAATPVIRVPVPTSGYQAGEVIWNAQSTDATDFRTTTGRIRFAGVNKAGTTTCTINVVGTDLTVSSNANTLVCTWTNVVNTTNCDLSVTCTDNTAGTQTMTINVRADMPQILAAGQDLIFP